MTNRMTWIRELELDLIGSRYLAAVDKRDWRTIRKVWRQAEREDDLNTMLHELHAALREEVR